MVCVSVSERPHKRYIVAENYEEETTYHGFIEVEQHHANQDKQDSRPDEVTSNSNSLCQHHITYCYGRGGEGGCLVFWSLVRPFGAAYDVGRVNDCMRGRMGR